MSEIILKNVSLDLPIYAQSSFSFGSLLKKLSPSHRFSFEGKTVVVQALKNITLSLKSGDRLGLIGLNGAGKTTLLKLLAGIYSPTAGTVSVEGRISCILGTGFGMDEEATGHENIFLAGVFCGISREKMKLKVDEIISFSELEDFIYLPIRTYSAGMRARLSFAIATCYTPEILLIDEGLGAGDASFFIKAQKRLKSFMENSSILVLASHANNLIREFCNQVIYLERGKIVSHGETEAIIEQYMNQVMGANA